MLPATQDEIDHVMQLRGKWHEAVRDAQDACELLRSRPAAGAAFYRLAGFTDFAVSSTKLKRRTRTRTNAAGSHSRVCRGFVWAGQDR